MNRNFKPTFNYDMEESNKLIKLGIFPIGCGIGTKDGQPYLVFRATKTYFDARDLIRSSVKNEV